MTPTPISVLKGAAATPKAFVLNGTGDLQIESVVAHVNGAAAGSDFDAVLSIYTQDGELLSRTKPPTSITAGDSAIVTWAPFLRKPSGAAAVTLGQFGNCYSTSDEHRSGNGTTTSTFSAVQTNDNTVFTGLDAGNNYLQVNAAGLYYVVGQIQVVDGPNPINGTATVSITYDPAGSINNSFWFTGRQPQARFTGPVNQNLAPYIWEAQIVSVTAPPAGFGLNVSLTASGGTGFDFRPVVNVYRFSAAGI